MMRRDSKDRFQIKNLLALVSWKEGNLSDAIEEMEEIGYEDCFYGDGVCLIEWAELIKEILPEKRRKILIEKDLEKGFDYRRITIEGEV